MAKSRVAKIKSRKNGKVNNISASGAGWGDMPAPPGAPDWASQQLTVHVDGMAYVVRADVAPGAFAAMAQLLIAAAQHRHYVDIAWFQPADPKATRVLTGVQIRDFADTW